MSQQTESESKLFASLYSSMYSLLSTITRKIEWTGWALAAKYRVREPEANCLRRSRSDTGNYGLICSFGAIQLAVDKAS